MTREVSVVIPCYRSAGYLRRTVEEILACAQVHPEYRMHLILVNDGSPDDTWQVIRALCQEHARCVTGIDLVENAGQAQAKMAALPFVRGTAVFMDDDGQHDPAEIPRLLRGIRKGYDLVYAQFPVQREAWYRRIGSRAVGLLMLVVTKKPRGLQVTSFFAVSASAVRELTGYRSRHPFIGGWLLLRGYRATGIRVRHRSRSTGRSGYTLKKLVRRAAEVLFLYRIQLKKEEADPYRIREIIGEASRAAHCPG